MNIMATRKCPYEAAKDQCDILVNKMATETVQTLVQGALSSGVSPDLMPLTKSTGKPHRGGYKHHPVVKWVQESFSNWCWLFAHGDALCREFFVRYGKEHFAQGQIDHLRSAFVWYDYFPDIGLTPFARCFNQSKGENEDLLDYEAWPCDHAAYREFYRRDKASFAKWEKGTSAPDWWHGEETIEVIA